MATGRYFAVCVDNDGYEASLERNKIYVVVSDKDAESERDLRVVDESGETICFRLVVSSPSTCLQPSSVTSEGLVMDFTRATAGKPEELTRVCRRETFS